MKILQDDNLILYLKKEYLKIKKIVDIEESFKEIFEILKEYYNIKINGFYDIDIYKDNKYGIIIVLRKELIDFDYYDNQIDMKLTFHESKFLYEIDDLYKFRNNKIYQYRNKFYIDINYPEFTNVIYDTHDIFKYGKIIEIKN